MVANWADLVQALANDESMLAGAVLAGHVEQVEVKPVEPEHVEVKLSRADVIDMCDELECHEITLDDASGIIVAGEW